MSAIHKKEETRRTTFKASVVQAIFQQWGLDFIGKFKDNSSNGYTWILTATDYFTKWIEAIPTKATTKKVVMDFLEDKIITRFGVPTKITTDNSKAFSSVAMSSFFFKYGIILSHSLNYYPWGNGLAESSNKNLMIIIRNLGIVRSSLEFRQIESLRKVQRGSLLLSWSTTRM